MSTRFLGSRLRAVILVIGLLVVATQAFSMHWACLETGSGYCWTGGTSATTSWCYDLEGCLYGCGIDPGSGTLDVSAAGYCVQVE